MTFVEVHLWNIANLEKNILVRDSKKYFLQKQKSVDQFKIAVIQL